MAKKKNKWIPAVAITLSIVLLLGGGLIFLKQTMEKANAMLSKPGEAQVTKMSIVSTVDGSGNLTAADTYDISIPTELIISETLVEVGDEVHEGDIIANIDTASITTAIVSAQNELDNIDKVLKDTSDMTDYEIEEYHTRQEYLNNKIDILTAFYLNPVIVATSDGVVTQLGSNSASSSDSGVDLSSYSDLLGKLDPGNEATGSDETTDSTSESSTETDATESTEPTEATTEPTESAEPSETAAPSETEPSAPTTPVVTAEMITDLTDLDITAPVNGETPQSEIEETDRYTGTVRWIAAGDTFGPGTSYTAMVTLEAKDGYIFGDAESLEYDIDGSTSVVATTLGNSCMLMITFEATEGSAPAATTPAPSVSGVDSAIAALPSDFDVNQFLAAYAGSTSPSISDYAALYSASNASNLSALASAYSGSATSGSGRPSTNTSENNVITIATTDLVKVVIDIDELDILGVEEGQTATVSCIAIPEREFEGTITHVSNIATSGTTKYRVEISLDMDPDMRLGMSADASIVVGESTNVLTIPMTALQQSGDENFVYTAVEEDGTLGGRVTVTTGVSDGTDVEIIGDISEGATVYYEQSAENALAAYMESAE